MFELLIIAENINKKKLIDIPVVQQIAMERNMAYLISITT